MSDIMEVCGFNCGGPARCFECLEKRYREEKSRADAAENKQKTITEGFYSSCKSENELRGLLRAAEKSLAEEHKFRADAVRIGRDAQERAKAAEARVKELEEETRRYQDWAKNAEVQRDDVGKSLREAQDRIKMLTDDMSRCDHHRQGCKEQALAAQVKAMREALELAINAYKTFLLRGDLAPDDEPRARRELNLMEDASAIPLSTAGRRVAAMQRVVEAAKDRHSKECGCVEHVGGIVGCAVGIAIKGLAALSSEES